MQPSAVDSMDKYNENLTDVKEIFRKGDLRAIPKPLLKWYDNNRRILPWREDPAPYRVWVSEIMLQQTRIEAVKGYYDRFLKRLPAVKDLAEIPQEELMKLWEGLGYYNRARNLQKAAQKVQDEYDGVLPADYEKLKSLPGIGNYTAGAIASIAYKIPAPAVDGNVMRVTMRLLGCRDDIMKGSVRRDMEQSLMAVMPKDKPGVFNEAWMELGEVVCIPGGTPLCDKCPLRFGCKACEQETWMEIPVKPPKKQRKIEKKTVLLLRLGSRTAIRQRENKGLLAGMWELPSLEGHKQKKTIEKMFGVPVVKRESHIHVFSHVEWHMTAYEVKLDEKEEAEKMFPGICFAEPEEITHQYALPVAFHSFLKNTDNT